MPWIINRFVWIASREESGGPRLHSEETLVEGKALSGHVFIFFLLGSSSFHSSLSGCANGRLRCL